MRRFALLLIIGVFLFGISGAAGVFADDDYLYVIGAAEGSNLYMSYLSVGLLGDAFEKGVYDAETAKSIALEINSLTISIRDTLKTLVEKEKVAGDDRVLILDMVAAHELLELQTGELIKYIENPKVANDFQYYRQQAWAKIAGILGIPAK